MRNLYANSKVWILFQEEKIEDDQEARIDDKPEDLEADSKQEEIHLPDRKVIITFDLFSTKIFEALHFIFFTLPNRHLCHY